ncbi:MAG: hypothetical protein HQK73_01145 [Desulfamplus sp.]|nr:hypothetical protein [Desulfamplus sp.]MBF0413012.1 hypothetical protein [Desulfamplus sp.]
MQIPSYQIQNVLKVYSRQLSQGRVIARNQQAGNDIQSSDKVKISAEGKRAAIIEKVAAGIVDKITTVGPQEAMEKEIAGQLEKEMGGQIDFIKRKGEKFSFNSIDENNQKTTQTLSVEDSNFVMKRMTQLAREAAGETREM